MCDPDVAAHWLLLPDLVLKCILTQSLLCYSLLLDVTVSDMIYIKNKTELLWINVAALLPSSKVFILCCQTEFQTRSCARHNC